MKVSELKTPTPDAVTANRALWIAAMRSGEYHTCIGSLVSVSSTGQYRYCPLGIAVAEVTPELPIKARIDYSREPFLSFKAPNGRYYTGGLPPETQRALGLRYASPLALVHGDWIAISILNDMSELSLADIADIIEQQGPDWDGTP